MLYGHDVVYQYCIDCFMYFYHVAVRSRRICHSFAEILTLFKISAVPNKLQFGNENKATLPSLFILPITYDQFSTGFTSFISSDRISQFKLSDTEIFKQFPDIRVVING